jgi:hypothetical protein
LKYEHAFVKVIEHKHLIGAGSMHKQRIDIKELLESIGAQNEEQQKLIDDLISDLVQAKPEQS